jgi:hypothetical protein
MKIEKCPFCGKDVAEISNCQELEGCRHFEKCPATEPYVCVVCNMFEGGCGASSGYYDSEAKAIAAWNRRADDERLKNALKEIAQLAREKAEREKGCAFCNTGAHRILQNALYCPRCGKRLEVEQDG